MHPLCNCLLYMKGFDLFMKNQYKNCSFNYKHGKLELVTESGDMLFSVSLRDACAAEDITPGKVDESTRYAIQDYIEMCLMDSGASCDQFTLESVVDMIYEDTDICSKMFSSDLGNDNALSEFDHFFGEAADTQPKSAIDKFNARFNRTPTANTTTQANNNNTSPSNNSKQSSGSASNQKPEHSSLDDIIAQYLIDAFINSYAAKTNANSNQNIKAVNNNNSSNNMMNRDSATKTDLLKLGVTQSKINSLASDTYQCYRDKVQNIRDAVDTILRDPKHTEWKFYAKLGKDNNGKDCVLVYFAYKDITDFTYQMSFHLRKHDQNTMGKQTRKKVGNKVKIEERNVNYIESLVGTTPEIIYSKIGARVPAKNIKRDFNVTV